MGAFSREVDWIAAQGERMARLVSDWALIPSQSHDVDGLAAMADALRRSFGALGGAVELLDLPGATETDSAGELVERPLGRALRLIRRPRAEKRLFLGCHMDTVHAREHSPPLARTGARLLGPGVADAKGGIAVLLVALEAFERSALADRVGWEVLVNPDEELSSPGSAPLLAAAAGRNHAGLVFEPAFPDGALVGRRKGSGNFTAVVRGRSAHVGRDFANGRNAIAAAARLVSGLVARNDERRGILVNVGRIAGGRALNVVPDLAVCGFNVRCDTAADQAELESALARAVDEARGDGLEIELRGGFLAPPKPLDGPTTALLEAIAACARDLGFDVAWRPTGGVSDGNRLAAAGLATVDTLGPRGGDIHTPREYLILDSLVERARHAALVMLRLAAGEIAWPDRTTPGEPAAEAR